MRLVFRKYLPILKGMVAWRQTQLRRMPLWLAFVIIPASQAVRLALNREMEMVGMNGKIASTRGLFLILMTCALYRGSLFERWVTTLCSHWAVYLRP